MKEFKVRLSDELAVQLKALAGTERRSVNAQVTLLIERAVRDGEARAEEEKAVDRLGVPRAE